MPKLVKEGVTVVHTKVQAIVHPKNMLDLAYAPKQSGSLTSHDGHVVNTVHVQRNKKRVIVGSKAVCANRSKCCHG